MEQNKGRRGKNEWNDEEKTQPEYYRGKTLWLIVQALRKLTTRSYIFIRDAEHVFKSIILGK